MIDYASGVGGTHLCLFTSGDFVQKSAQGGMTI